MIAITLLPKPDSEPEPYRPVPIGLLGLVSLGLAVSHLIPLINPFESDSDGSNTDGEFDESLEEEMNEYTDMEPEEFRSEE